MPLRGVGHEANTRRAHAEPPATVVLATELDPWEIVSLAAWAAHRGTLRHGRRSDLVVRGPKPRRTFLRRARWMVCQYSGPGPVSSEKHKMPADAAAEERGGTPQASGPQRW